MRKPILIVFRHDDKVHSMVIRPTDPDWWTSYGGFDIHYCENYNQICVYKSGDNYVTIYKQKINDENVKNKVLASKFIEWYYSNHDEVVELGKMMAHLMKVTGQCNLSVQELFDSCGYIPKYICVDISEDMYTTDYNPEDVKLINDFEIK